MTVKICKVNSLPDVQIDIILTAAYVTDHNLVASLLMRIFQFNLSTDDSKYFQVFF